jgi:hypothetical protein
MPLGVASEVHLGLFAPVQKVLEQLRDDSMHGPLLR